MTLFLVSALGSAGDVHPFIAISQALVARGHRVTLLAAPHFAERIAKAGIAFAPMGAPGDYERMLGRPELWRPRSGARFVLDELVRRLPDAYATTAALVEPGRTVLVGSTLAWGSRLVQDATGLPGATIHLSPLCIPSAEGPPVVPGVGDLAWMPLLVRRALDALVDRVVIDPRVCPTLNRLRGQLGLPPVRHVWSRWMHAPDLVVGAWPAWFAPRHDDWPAQAVTSGFPLFHEAHAPLDAALEAFLATGARPVGITPGSAMAHGRDFFAQALEACRRLGHRAVLVTPFRDQLPASLPPWAHHVAYAPFGALLPRLALLVHHGGIGTSAQALAAGLPQLVVPFAHDQFDNAARLRRLGVARTVKPGTAAAAWVQALLDLADPAVLAAVRDAARRMDDAGASAPMIADLLERLVPGRR